MKFNVKVEVRLVKGFGLCVAVENGLHIILGCLIISFE